MRAKEIIVEVKMTSKNLRKEAAKLGAQAGIEFEMIVPDVQNDDSYNNDPEIDRDADREPTSIDDVVDFFDNDGHNSRRQLGELREQLEQEFSEWISAQISDDWKNDYKEYISDYVNNSKAMHEDAREAATNEIKNANPELDESSNDFVNLVETRTTEIIDQAIQYAIDRKDNSSVYREAWDQFKSEQQEEYEDKEDEYLNDQYGPSVTMWDMYQNTDVSWPYYEEPSSSGDGIEEVAADFATFMGKKVNTGDYHQARREPGKYVVEPDGSLEPDRDTDSGLEFVSPPLPIDELLTDLAKVKKWANRRGCYTNDSTGLHINISVPNYDISKLDYVKLAILMGDEYVLDYFGRTGNTYAASAMGKIREILVQEPSKASKVMDMLKQGLDGIATKAIHDGQTNKYTSINTKDGYIEFRSPGGDWLGDNFDKIETTLLRFTVALGAAIDPESYRKEYMTKLYKLLSESMPKSDMDVIQLFSNYSSGQLDKAALIRQVKAQHNKKKIEKDAASGKMYVWQFSNRSRAFKVVADGRENAKEQSAIKLGMSLSYILDSHLTPLYPYVAQTDGPKWGIYNPLSQRFITKMDVDTGEAAVYTFDSAKEANDFYEDAKANRGARVGFVVVQIPPEYQAGEHYVLPRTPPTDAQAAPQQQQPTVDFSQLGSNTTGSQRWQIIRMSDRTQVGEFNADNHSQAEQHMERVLNNAGMDPTQYDVRLAPAQPTQPRSSGEFTGEWRIVNPDNGNAYHQFGGVGNSQADANRVAANWIRANLPSVRTFEVEPVMEQ
jgi:hypothetical protein